MPVVIVGHVDHGKSTIIGRLLADTDSLPLGKLEQARAQSAREGRPFEFAFLVDALRDERAQNITIDAARIFFRSEKRHYLLLDAPGHIEFVKNMVTGASHADAALLVIDAAEGVRENTRRHGYLLWLLGIRQVVVLVNKMDLVGWSRAAFEAVRAEYQAFLDQVGLRPAAWIPVSGRAGANIAQPGPEMPWHTGPTVLGALDAFALAAPAADRPLRLPVQDIYRFAAAGDARRILAGTLSSGRVRPGDELVFHPSGKRSTVRSLEVFSAPQPAEFSAGQAASLTLEEQIYIQRGEIASRAGQPAPAVSSRLRASVLWLGTRPLAVGTEFWLKLGTARAKGHIESILRLIDTGQGLSADGALPAALGRHDVAECVIRLQRALAFDAAADYAETGRFVLVVDHEIGGGGIVLEPLDDAQRSLRESVLLRNLKWGRSLIPPETRAEQYRQRAALVLITGRRDDPRKEVARALEAQLFEGGRIAYYLTLGSVLYGLDADLRDQDRDAAHPEHIRRLAEVAHILLDAGLILIVTAVELSQADLETIATAVEPGQIETVWVGGPVTTDLETGLRLGPIESPQSAALQIQRRLQERGDIQLT